MDGHLAEILAKALIDLDPCPIGIAVSGGGDSMALLDLAHGALTPRGFTILAATVDHALRAESRAEAQSVADFCAARDISHQMLTWTHGPLTATRPGNLMDNARQARMDLLAAWALGQGAPVVLLGHTQDDQAESFLMNLSRAAGIDGLSGMRPSFTSHGVTWHRPLLSVTRADLRDHLAARKLTWIEDPSNDNDRFARSRARKALKAMAGLGINAGGIAASVAHLQDARRVLLSVTAEAARTLSRTEAAALVLSPLVLSLPLETLRRLVVATIQWMAGAEYPPRGTQLDRLIAALHAGRPAQLAGLRFQTRKAEIWIAPEMRALTFAPSAFSARWRLAAAPIGLEWRVIGEAGLAQRPHWRKSGLPRLALEPAPALWCREVMVAAPALDPPEITEIRAEIAQSLADCISLH